MDIWSGENQRLVWRTGESTKSSGKQEASDGAREAASAGGRLTDRGQHRLSHFISGRNSSSRTANGWHCPRILILIRLRSHCSPLSSKSETMSRGPGQCSALDCLQKGIQLCRSFRLDGGCFQSPNWRRQRRAQATIQSHLRTLTSHVILQQRTPVWESCPQVLLFQCRCCDQQTDDSYYRYFPRPHSSYSSLCETRLNLSPSIFSYSFYFWSVKKENSRTNIHKKARR